MTRLRHPRAATTLLVEARPVARSVVIRTTADTLFAENMLTLRQARTLSRQLEKAIAAAAAFPRKTRAKGS